MRRRRSRSTSSRASTPSPAIRGAAARKGADDAGQSYSGNWKPVKETMVFSVNHQVAPKAEALSCGSCHGPNDRLDYKKPGYDEEKIRKRSGAL